jgi:hypothetical protein
VCVDGRAGPAIPQPSRFLAVDPRSASSSATPLRRELPKETGRDVGVGRVLGVVASEVLPGRSVDIVGFECPVAANVGRPPIVPSHEHASVGFLDPATLRADALPSADRELIVRR